MHAVIHYDRKKNSALLAVVSRRKQKTSPDKEKSRAYHENQSIKHKQSEKSLEVTAKIHIITP